MGSFKTPVVQKSRLALILKFIIFVQHATLEMIILFKISVYILPCVCFSSWNIALPNCYTITSW